MCPSYLDTCNYVRVPLLLLHPICHNAPSPPTHPPAFPPLFPPYTLVFLSPRFPLPTHLPVRLPHSLIPSPPLHLYLPPTNYVFLKNTFLFSRGVNWLKPASGRRFNGGDTPGDQLMSPGTHKASDV